MPLICVQSPVQSALAVLKFFKIPLGGWTYTMSVDSLKLHIAVESGGPCYHQKSASPKCKKSV
jgi:hypothetical protein